MAPVWSRAADRIGRGLAESPHHDPPRAGDRDAGRVRRPRPPGPQPERLVRPVPGPDRAGRGPAQPRSARGGVPGLPVQPGGRGPPATRRGADLPPAARPALRSVPGRPRTTRPSCTGPGRTSRATRPVGRRHLRLGPVRDQARSLAGALGTTLHDHAITDALDDATETIDPRQVVGIMGGHALLRTDPAYAAAARLGADALRPAGRLVLTGGGPGRDGGGQPRRLPESLAGRARRRR